MKELNIAISANFTIEPIAPGLNLFLDKLEIPHQIKFAPYNQIFRQLLDSSSLFRKNQQGVNAVFLRTEDLIDRRNLEFNPGSDELKKIDENAVDLANWMRNAENFSVPLFVFICPPSQEIVEQSDIYSALGDIEKTLIDAVSRIPNVYIFTTVDISAQYKIETFDNPSGNSLGHIPYTQSYFSVLGAMLARKIDALHRNPYKVVVLDCDNTLWKGICGEDGTDGIKFDEPWLAVQRLAMEQSEAGMLVCLCSKNNEADVWNVFDTRMEMVLDRGRIVSTRINWEPKSKNLKSLADELQLGLDSFIFIDDDPVVCSEVRMNCPSVLTLQLPADSQKFSNFLAHTWAFDKLTITKEDKERTKSYQQQGNRQKIYTDSSDINEFLSKLQLVCNIAEITSEQIPRVSQLSLRTNQFNSTTVRRSEAEIQKIIADGKINIWTINVSDRFGDYGLVGTVFFRAEDKVCEVESLMLSCRVLGRGVEHKILEALAKKSQDLGLKFVNIHFHPTPKNTPILEFLNQIGRQFLEEDVEERRNYRIPIADALKITVQSQPGNDKTAPVLRDKNFPEVKNNENYSRVKSYPEIAETLTSAEEILAILNVEKTVRSNMAGEFVAPRDKTEEKLTKIWQKILNLTEVSARDNFFNLNGDSLVAVSLFVEIEEEFGKSLPLLTLINAPTIEKIAAVLRDDDSNSDWKYLVPIQTEGIRPPLFCMHAAGGNVLFYCDLAKELGVEQPVYGLQARGVADKNETAHNRVEEMAAVYLEEIRQLQPSGPYRLCGSSFGGLVAFEAARQLQSAGESTSVLALFDTYAPGYPQSKPERFPFEHKITNLIDRSKNAKNQLDKIESNSQKLEFIQTRIRKLKKLLGRKITWKKNEFQIQYGAATGKQLPKDVLRNHKAIQKALENYQPEVYDGQIILFRAAQQPSNAIFDSYLGWQKFTSEEIVIEEVAGTHGALTVYPFAAELAEKFQPYLISGQIAEKQFAAAGL